MSYCYSRPVEYYCPPNFRQPTVENYTPVPPQIMAIATQKPKDLGKLPREKIIADHRIVTAARNRIFEKRNRNIRTRDNAATIIQPIQARLQIQLATEEEKLVKEAFKEIYKNQPVMGPDGKPLIGPNGMPVPRQIPPNIKTFRDLTNYIENEAYSASREYDRIDQGCLLQNYDSQGYFTDPCFKAKADSDPCFVRRGEVLTSQINPSFKCAN
jgi:hypothetical protein